MDQNHSLNQVCGSSCSRPEHSCGYWHLLGHQTLLSRAQHYKNIYSSTKIQQHNTQLWTHQSCSALPFLSENVGNHKTSSFWSTLSLQADNTTFWGALRAFPVSWAGSCMSHYWCGCKKCKPKLCPQDAKCTLLSQNTTFDIGDYFPSTSEASHVLPCLLFHILTHTLVSNELCDSTKMQMWQQTPAKNQLWTCVKFRSPKTLSEEPSSSLISLGAFPPCIQHIPKPCVLLHSSQTPLVKHTMT